MNELAVIVLAAQCQKSAATHACMRVVAGLIDTPYMRHEVARKRHENAECGSVVGVAEQRNHA